MGSYEILSCLPGKVACTLLFNTLLSPCYLIGLYYCIEKCFIKHWWNDDTYYSTIDLHLNIFLWVRHIVDPSSPICSITDWALWRSPWEIWCVITLHTSWDEKTNKQEVTHQLFIIFFILCHFLFLINSCFPLQDKLILSRWNYN